MYTDRGNEAPLIGERAADLDEAFTHPIPLSIDLLDLKCISSIRARTDVVGADAAVPEAGIYRAARLVSNERELRVPGIEVPGRDQLPVCLHAKRGRLSPVLAGEIGVDDSTVAEGCIEGTGVEIASKPPIVIPWVIGRRVSQCNDLALREECKVSDRLVPRTRCDDDAAVAEARIELAIRQVAGQRKVTHAPDGGVAGSSDAPVGRYDHRVSRCTLPDRRLDDAVAAKALVKTAIREQADNR